MFRLNQIIRNLFLRLEGFLSVVFKSLFSLVGNFLGFFANVFGFNKPGYFLESDEAQGINRNSDKEPIETKPDKTPEVTSPTRRPHVKMDDYYLNMARDVKKK